MDSPEWHNPGPRKVSAARASSGASIVIRTPRSGDGARSKSERAFLLSLCTRPGSCECCVCVCCYLHALACGLHFIVVVLIYLPLVFYRHAVLAFRICLCADGRRVPKGTPYPGKGIFSPRGQNRVAPAPPAADQRQQHTGGDGEHIACVLLLCRTSPALRTSCTCVWCLSAMRDHPACLSSSSPFKTAPALLSRRLLFAPTPLVAFVLPSLVPCRWRLVPCHPCWHVLCSRCRGAGVRQ